MKYHTSFTHALFALLLLCLAGMSNLSARNPASGTTDNSYKDDGDFPGSGLGLSQNTTCTGYLPEHDAPDGYMRSDQSLGFLNGAFTGSSGRHFNLTAGNMHRTLNWGNADLNLYSTVTWQMQHWRANNIANLQADRTTMILPWALTTDLPLPDWTNASVANYNPMCEMTATADTPLPDFAYLPSNWTLTDHQMCATNGFLDNDAGLTYQLRQAAGATSNTMGDNGQGYQQNIS